MALCPKYEKATPKDAHLFGFFLLFVRPTPRCYRLERLCERFPFAWKGLPCVEYFFRCHLLGKGRSCVV